MKERTKRLLDKAARSIRAAESLARAGDFDFAAGRSYYAMFYTAQALLHEIGLSFRKHSGVISGYGEHFARSGRLDPKYHRWLIAAFETRLEADYGTDVVLSEKEVATLLQRARDFLEAAIDHLGGSGFGEKPS